jgi:hypothetical protein
MEAPRKLIAVVIPALTGERLERWRVVAADAEGVELEQLDREQPQGAAAG